jgi:hypothetical protein
MERYPHINPEHHPHQFRFAFGTWFNTFRYTEEAAGNTLNISQEETKEQLA